jgi:polyhydroxyalkanoate synthesis regulator phasin
VLLRGVGVGRAVRSTVILGAGASRGASFADATRQVLPPLDADFFQQAQRLDEQTFITTVREVIDFVRDEYGPTRQPTLETVFTQLQGYQQFLQQFSVRPGRRPETYKRQLGYLLGLIPLVFRAAFNEQRCLWHERIAYALRKGDAVVSFNYDTVIDDALRRWSDGIWLADRGYGFKIKEGTAEWSAGRTPGPLPQKQYLRLLKPHGSLHWTAVDHEGKSLRLASDPYAQHSARDNIIPPTWDKTVLGQWPWKPVWEEAARVLKDTRCLIVVGYSVPATDLTSQALIRSSLSGGSLRLLVVANPDPEARARVIDLARGAITSRTRVLELSYLTDFVRLLDMTPEEERARDETARRLRTAQRRIRDLQSAVRKLDDRTEDVEFVDVEALEDRVDTLESRIDDLETARE